MKDAAHAVPYQAIIWCEWFMARVATRSPRSMPSLTRAWASLRLSLATSRQLVLVIVPPAQAVTISALPCSRSAWSTKVITRKGQCCIAPNATHASKGSQSPVDKLTVKQPSHKPFFGAGFRPKKAA
jgi:hypothetical protein